MEQTYLVEVKDLVKQFSNKRIENTIINKLNLEIESGEFVIIVGRSGTGKSTLLNLVGGLERATSGSIRVHGQAIEKYSGNQLAKLRKEMIGFIFQDFNLLEGYTAYENIEIAMSDTQLSQDEIAERINTLLSEFNIGDKGDFMPRELSIGQQQRVAVARALINKPSLLLADEPTGGMDHITAKEIADHLYHLNKKFNLSVVVTTHGVFPMEKADRVIYLKEGNIVSKEEAGFFDS